MKLCASILVSLRTFDIRNQDFAILLPPNPKDEAMYLYLDVVTKCCDGSQVGHVPLLRAWILLYLTPST
jgi:hypothetical protein